ncbi:MAG: bifunctional methionine sulfoxide reductase B/A protein [Bacillota bacterium]
MVYNRLNEEEDRIISGKGTEKPFSGIYDDFFQEGVYLCRRCNALLYEAKDKFDAGCGWPSFDDEVTGAVRRSPDPDGLRTEISCSSCGAHLGHVFTGEKQTAKDTRHCVNSLSMRFIPWDYKAGEVAEAYFAGGCFWCLEAVFQMIKGIDEVSSGYSGGQIDKPTYERVSLGDTGYAETVRIDYNEAEISFKRLLEVFFSVHDPSTYNRQGNDIGTQYRSVIFYKTWRQRQEARKMIEELDEKRIFGGKIVTELVPFIQFYPAEEEHKEYYRKHPERGYCRLVIDPKITKLRKDWQHLLK